MEAKSPALYSHVPQSLVILKLFCAVSHLYYCSVDGGELFLKETGFLKVRQYVDG